MLIHGQDALDLDPDFLLDYEELSAILVELGADYTRMQGNNCQADHCFLHENDHPTLGVSLDSPHPWGCLSGRCGQKGRAITSLVSAALGISKSQAVAWMLQRYPDSRVSSQRSLFETEEVKTTKRFVLSKASLMAYPLDADKGIGYRAIDFMSEDMGYTFCTHQQADEYQLGYDLQNDRLIFPVFHPDGELAGLIGRSMRRNPKFRYYNYDEGEFKKSLTLMGAEQPLVPGHPVVVVEGPTDYIYLRSCGVRNVRAFMGAKFSDFQLEMICGYGFPVVPLFDRDKAGMDAAYKIRQMIGNRVRLKSFRYPTGSGKDPRSIPRVLVPKLVASFGKLSFVPS